MKKIKQKAVSLLMGISLVLPAIAGCAPSGKAANVEVDFGTKDGQFVQNLKKFDNFTSTWAWVGEQTGTTDAKILNTTPALDEIKAENLRFDLFMGYNGLGYEIGRGGKDGSSPEEYVQTMQVVEKLKENHVNPYVTYFAAPEYCGTNWKRVDDYAKWEELCKNIATYFKDSGVRLGAHEVWNEPDFNSSFFAGDWVDYIDTYLAGAKGIRAGNPDATLVGMSVAYAQKTCVNKTTVAGDGVKTNFQRFIERTSAENMLPDAISWHYYGRQGQISGREDASENLASYLNTMRSSIQGYQNGTHADLEEGVNYPELETMQQHLNEFNIYEPSVDAIYQTVEMLPGMFYAFDALLAATDVTRVNWASLVGEKNGKLSYDLIDGQSLQRYPAYHALWMYAHLPVDRVNVDLNNKNLGTMAGVDSHRGGLIVYNKADKEEKINVKFKNLPFAKGDLDVYLVDEDHYSYTTQNAPLKVRARADIDTEGLEVRMTLKPNSAYYIEINDPAGKSDTDDYAKVGDVVRKDYWYYERGDNFPYAEIHENSFTAHVGMAGKETGKSAVAVTLDGMKNKNGLAVKFETWGNPVAGDNSALGVRVDYCKEDGTYEAGKLYAVASFAANPQTPFSHDAAADVVSMGTDGNYALTFADAPADWNGRIRLTYLILDAGKGATAKFIVRAN